MAWAMVAAMLMLAAAIDLATGAGVTLIFFYMSICAFAAWTLGERSGLYTALFTIPAAAVIAHLQRDVPEALTTQVWNTAMRTLSAMLLVAMVSALRTALERERWRASVDSLTGVLNKTAFLSLLPQRVATAATNGEALMLCYIDLDGFKQVNDRFGHSAGDEVLRRFGVTATESIRKGDLFARFGGDEFVGLLIVPNIPEGDTAAEAIFARLSGILRDMDLGVGCSMGALVMDPPASGRLEGAMNLADALMYEVKRAGKDALRIGHPDLSAIEHATAVAHLPGRPGSKPVTGRIETPAPGHWGMA
jgi:diguanylate cyclase (GGDEF)-like protein